MEGEKPRGLQLYTNNYRKLRKLKVGGSSSGTETAVSPKNMHRDKIVATEIALINREPMKLKEIK